MYAKAAKSNSITDALEDVNSAVSRTSNVSGLSAASLTSILKLTSINQAAYQAMFDAIAELSYWKTSL